MIDDASFQLVQQCWTFSSKLMLLIRIPSLYLSSKALPFLSSFLCLIMLDFARQITESNTVGVHNFQLNRSELQVVVSISRRRLADPSEASCSFRNPIWIGSFAEAHGPISASCFFICSCIQVRRQFCLLAGTTHFFIVSYPARILHKCENYFPFLFNISVSSSVH